jgi:hypothetical protein
MRCHCCRTAVSLARKVRLREVDPDPDPDVLPPFAVAFVCQACYAMLNTVDGVGLVDHRMYQLDPPSRFGKAPLFTADMQADYARAEALKVGAAPAAR